MFMGHIQPLHHNTKVCVSGKQLDPNSVEFGVKPDPCLPCSLPLLSCKHFWAVMAGILSIITQQESFLTSAVLVHKTISFMSLFCDIVHADNCDLVTYTEEVHHLMVCFSASCDESDLMISLRETFITNTRRQGISSAINIHQV